MCSPRRWKVTQRECSPARQSSHSPQLIPGFSTTSSPGFPRVTPGPTDAITPAPSDPITWGRATGIPGMPLRTKMSRWLRAAAFILTRTRPGPAAGGSGRSPNSTRSGPPCSRKNAAFMARLLARKNRLLRGTPAQIPVQDLGRDVRGVDHRSLPLLSRDRADKIPQLPDIPRPVVRFESGDRRGGEPTERFLPLPVRLLQEMVQQQRHVLEVLPQRRNAHDSRLQRLEERRRNVLSLRQFVRGNRAGSDDPDVQQDRF